LSRFIPIALVLTAGCAWAQIDLGRVLSASTPLRVVAFGDFGSGSRGQIETAKALQRRNQEQPYSLGLTLGDNFYRCGVRSVHDPKWKTRWEDLYTPLGIRFYASLGNHDYGHPTPMCMGYSASPQAEIDRTVLSQSWVMPARYYTYTAGPVRFIAIDTEGWKPAQLQWIRETLEASRNEPGIQWRVVYGHHPIFSSGFHANERRIGRLRRELLPVLKANNVDLYICGHDHNIEHLRSGGIEFLVSGGGGAHLRPAKNTRPESLFTSGGHGFLELAINAERIEAQFYDTKLRPLEPAPVVLSRDSAAGAQ
jgi:tartrate-resistant acid phosphatase type 5